MFINNPFPSQVTPWEDIDWGRCNPEQDYACPSVVRWKLEKFEIIWTNMAGSSENLELYKDRNYNIEVMLKHSSNNKRIKIL